MPPSNLSHEQMPGNEMPLEAAPAVDATPEAESQPDSEPCMPPASQADSEYTPTTPLHEETNETPALKPEEIPVPEADDLMLEDVWVCQPDKILRIHNKPRFSAFDPSSCTDCPVDILHLSDTRVTTAQLRQEQLGSNMIRGGVMRIHGAKIIHGLESPFSL